MKLKINNVLSVFLAGFILGTSPAFAQSDDVVLSAPKNVAVQNRARPEYTPTGVKVGGFRLFPVLTIAAHLDDNVYAAEDDAEQDVVGVLAPRAELRSAWSTHALNLAMGAQARQYTEQSDLSYENYFARAHGQLDVDRNLTLEGGLGYRRDAETNIGFRRGQPLGEAAEFSRKYAEISASKTFNRFKLEAQSTWRQIDHDDATLLSGVTLSQDDRDRDDLELRLTADYALSPDTKLFLELRSIDYDYDLSPPAVGIDRDSTGYQALIGTRFGVTNLMRGEIGFGYLEQAYDAEGVEDTSSPTFMAGVEWYIDPLITLSFDAFRSVEDAGVINAVSYVTSDAAAKLDYEYRRNWIFTGELGYAADEYEGVDRKDDRWRATISTEYMINREIGLLARYSHFNQSSSGLNVGRNYDVNQFTLTLRLRR